MPGRKRKGRDLRATQFDPEASVRFVNRVLQETGIRLAVIGRFAVWGWVEDEERQAMTKDFDVAVARSDMPFLEEWLNLSSLPIRPLTIGGLNVRHPNSGVNVDFIDRSDASWGDFSALFKEAVEAALTEEVVLPFGEIEIPLTPPEYLVVMKLLTGERDDELDAVRLLGTPSAEIDIEAVREIIMEHTPGVRGTFERVLREVNHPQAYPHPDSQGPSK